MGVNKFLTHSVNGDEEDSSLLRRYSEPGRVEARRAASGNPITSELKSPKRRE